MAKITISIKDVFTLGTFGPIRLGQTQEEVEKILGRPTYVYNSIYGEEDEYNVKFLRYDSYEFWFIKYYDDSGQYKLSGFEVRDYHYINGYEGAFKKGIVIDSWIFKHGLSMDDIEKSLGDEGLSFTKAQEYVFTVLNFKNQAKVNFIPGHHSDALVCEGWSYHPKDTAS